MKYFQVILTTFAVCNFVNLASTVDVSSITSSIGSVGISEQSSLENKIQTPSTLTVSATVSEQSSLENKIQTPSSATLTVSATVSEQSSLENKIRTPSTLTVSATVNVQQTTSNSVQQNTPSLDSSSRTSSILPSPASSQVMMSSSIAPSLTDWKDNCKDICCEDDAWKKGKFNKTRTCTFQGQCGNATLFKEFACQQNCKGCSSSGMLKVSIVTMIFVIAAIVFNL